MINKWNEGVDRKELLQYLRIRELFICSDDTGRNCLRRGIYLPKCLGYPAGSETFKGAFSHFIRGRCLNVQNRKQTVNKHLIQSGVLPEANLYYNEEAEKINEAGIGIDIMIVFDHVTKSYGSNVGIVDVSIKIEKGDFVFLVRTFRRGEIYFY